MRNIFKRFTIAAAAISCVFLFFEAYPHGSPLTIAVPLAILGFYRVGIWIVTGERLFTFPKRAPAPKISPCKAASIYMKR